MKATLCCLRQQRGLSVYLAQIVNSKMLVDPRCTEAAMAQQPRQRKHVPTSTEMLRCVGVTKDVQQSRRNFYAKVSAQVFHIPVDIPVA